MKLSEILVVILVIVLVFGASRLPQLGKAIGEGFKELKRGLREAEEEEKTARDEEPVKPKAVSSAKRSAKKTSSKKRV